MHWNVRAEPERGLECAAKGGRLDSPYYAWARRGTRHGAPSLSQTLVVYPPMGSMATERQMSTPPTLLMGHGPLYLYKCTLHMHTYAQGP